MAQECQMERLIKPIIGKWKPNILLKLSAGPLRMSEIEHRIPQAHPRVLKRQMRSLEADGIVQKKIFEEVPPRVEYSLTEYGTDTIRMLDSIAGNPVTLDLLEKYGITTGRNGRNELEEKILSR